MWPFGAKRDAEAASAVPMSVAHSAAVDQANRGGPFLLKCATDLGHGPAPVFPLLMPSPAFTPGPTQIARPILAGPDLPDLPWITLVYLLPAPESPGRTFVRRERAAQLGRTVADFESEAIANIGLRPAVWQRLEPGPGARMLVCTDDYLAAEHILDREFLRQGGELLGESSLVLGIPCRGQLCATPSSEFSSRSPHAKTFKMMVEWMHAAAGETAITRWLFEADDGELGGVLEVA